MTISSQLLLHRKFSCFKIVPSKREVLGYGMIWGESYEESFGGTLNRALKNNSTAFNRTLPH